MDTRRLTLSDMIVLNYGPRELLSHYFTAVEEALLERGLLVSISTDFEKLVALNSAHRDSWVPLLPFSDPCFNDLRDAFWLDVRNTRGETIMTHCGRLFDWHDTTLEREIKSLRLLYNDPAPHVAAGEVIDVVDTPSASRITGRVLLTSAAWIRPDFRRHGLTKLVPRLSRAHAYARWLTKYTICFVEPHLHAIGISRAYGDYNVEDGVVFPLKQRGKVQYMLLWMTGETMLDEIADIVRRRQNGSVPQQRSA
jgi:hypothetical protein